ncbi:MAG: HD domain-containing protein [Bacteroidales bacterium]|nr:HD domain-containing protein [Bacteroidales bacterium]
MNNWFPTNKIVNDPVHGFITIEYKLLLDILNHPWMQRLRRIHQLGMTSLVYPGALHTRFQHALGAMHLIHLAMDTLQNKGTLITEDEQRAAMAAMLLHDIGHGPFSHVLERSIVNSVTHEEISKVLMERMNQMMGGRLDRTIDIFEGRCKPFLHQLISSQLDTDRLDYLKRDSFYTGVSEGTIGSDRIIKMLDVHDDKLVVEAKGIYSVEKFLIARRLMYWQVYLHKTVMSAERMLTSILRRAKNLTRQGKPQFAPPHLAYFFENEIDKDNFDEYETIRNFTLLDDNDIMSAIKVWTMSDDRILATLSTWFINRHLLHIDISENKFSDAIVEEACKKTALFLKISEHDARYFVITGRVKSNTYNSFGNDTINIIGRDGDIYDVSEKSELDFDLLGDKDSRWYLCYPRGVTL